MTAHLLLADGATRDGAPIRVVLADDHLPVRRSLRLLLESERGVVVVAEAGDLAAALHQAGGELPDVLVLDLQMPDGSSLETIRRLHAVAPGTAIVVAMMEDGPLFAQRALREGAVGYVLKPNADTELPEAVRCAVRGETFISPCVLARLDALQRGVEHDGLTPRETEVLRLIALGFTSAEVSAKLRLSRRTIESHRARIHRKLGRPRRSDLVRYALDHGLIGDIPQAAPGARRSAPH